MIATAALRPFLALLLAVAACDRAKTNSTAGSTADTMATRAARLQEALAASDSGADAAVLARWLLPRELDEISGLALTADGRLLAHNDQDGTVWEIDYRRGVLVKRFDLGKQPIKGDFEGIAIASDRIFMIGSNGKLYEFREGADGQRVAYTVHDTRLGSECEFEGVAFDPNLNSLLLACKNVEGKQDSLVIYRWKLQSGDGERLSRLAVPIANVIGSNNWKSLHPSDITIDPFSGNYVLIAAQERALIEITPTGDPISARPLSVEHVQAEGVAITPEGILILSDESAGKGARASGHRPAAAVSLYRWQ
jgi:uncharacterized protein YjiK